MIEIDKTIVSLDLVEEQFLCDLIACKGACCIEGDSGAPLTKEEAMVIRKNYSKIKKHLDIKYQKIITEKGHSVIDSDGDLVTPLFNNRECVYTFTDENGILKCAIERAFLEGKSNFRKPISCHLFPVRITEYKDFDAVNYQQLDICKVGRTCGTKQHVLLYEFLKEPLIRKYGEEWWRKLKIAAHHVKK